MEKVQKASNSGMNRYLDQQVNLARDAGILAILVIVFFGYDTNARIITFK
jgi:hypothetical protein